MARPGLHITIRVIEIADASALAEFHRINRDFFTPFEPIRPESDYTSRGQRARIADLLTERDLDRGYPFVVILDDGEIVGRVNLSNVSRGAWQNATIGYSVAEQYNGRGVATEAVRLAVDYGFKQVGLHRVQAGVMPRNVASARVLTKVGFRLEGYSPRYININGTWEDHDIYAVTVEEWVG